MCPKILILEDDPVTAKAYEMLLTSSKCEVKIAPHIEPAMKLCRDGWPTVIILDIQLPMEDIGGIGCWDGMDFLKWIQAMVKERPPVFVISSHADPVVKEKALAAGAKAYFTKPVAKAALVKAVYQSVDQSCPVWMFDLEPNVQEPAKPEPPPPAPPRSRFGSLIGALTRPFCRRGSS